MSTFAYHPRPLADAALDSHLSHIAAGLCTTRNTLLAEVGIKSHPADLVRDLDRPTLQRLCDLTRLDVDEVQQMTLHRWRALGLHPDKYHRGHAGDTWAIGSGTRHCPACLDERDGIFRLHWHLHWSFACTRHGTPLVTTTSDTHPHDQSYGRSQAEEPGVLRADHPVLTAQQFVGRILHTPLDPVESLGRFRGTREVLADVAALTRVGLAAMSNQNSEALIADIEAHQQVALIDVLPLLPDRLVADTSAAALGLGRNEPLTFALAVHLALAVVLAPTVDEAATAAWWLRPSAALDLLSHHRSRRISWPLARVLQHHTDHPVRRGQTLMRFSLTRFDDTNHLRTPLHAHHIPAAGWPTVHLNGPGSDPDINTIAVAVALLMIGSGMSVLDALARLRHDHLQYRVRQDWERVFAADPHGDANFETLLCLHHTLTSAQIPIDYDRRRRCFPTPQPLGDRAANRLSRDTGTRLTPRARAFVSWRIWELLTGSDALLTPGTVEAHGNQRTAYKHQRQAWITHDPQPLRDLAEAALKRHRIAEPLTWTPRLIEGEWILPTPPSRKTPADPTTQRGPARPPAAEPLGYSLEAAVAFAAPGQHFAETGSLQRRLFVRLRQFAAIAEEGGVLPASRRLGVSDNCVRLGLQCLEGELQTPLFERETRGCRDLTPQGAHLVRLLRVEIPDLLTPFQQPGVHSRRKAS